VRTTTLTTPSGERRVVAVARTSAALQVRLGV
jgi:hypothetical protein